MNMNKNNIESGSRLSRCIKASFRVLRRARDSYVNGMTGYADRMRCRGTPFHRSFSVSSSRASEDDDLRALMRAVSWRRQEERSETGAGEAMGSKGLPESSSVGIGRIDEDEPCYFRKIWRWILMCPCIQGVVAVEAMLWVREQQCLVRRFMGLEGEKMVRIVSFEFYVAAYL